MLDVPLSLDVEKWVLQTEEFELLVGHIERNAEIVRSQTYTSNEEIEGD